MAARFLFPPDTRLYCRGCCAVRPHNETGGRVACVACGRTIETAELVTVYATDTDSRPAKLLFPMSLLSPLAYAQRLHGALGSREELPSD